MIDINISTLPITQALHSATHIQLVINSICAFFVAGYNIYYVVRWRNGKLYVCLFTTVVFTYLAIIQLAAFFYLFGLDPVTYGSTWVRPILPGVYVIPFLHSLIDSKKNERDRRVSRINTKGR